MRSLEKGDARKQAVAWLMKGRTVVKGEWRVPHLGMGHRSNISRAVSAFRTAADRERRQPKKSLHICTD